MDAVNNKTSPSVHNGHILGLAAVLFLPIGVFLSKGIAPLFAVAAVSCLVLGLWRNRAIPFISGPVTYALAALVAWALVSWFWSITPGETLKTGISLVGTFFGGAVLFAVGTGLDAAEKKIFQIGIILGGAIGFPLIAFEFATDAWLTQFVLGLSNRRSFDIYGDHTNVLNSGMAATALFFWSWALVMRTRFSSVVSIPAILVGIVLILLTYADAVVLSFAVGAVAFAASLAWPRWAPWALGAAVVVGVLTAPMIPGLMPNPLVSGQNLSWLTPSSAHRIVIWKNTVGHIEQKPILGGGFDTARGLYSVKDRVQYTFPKEISGEAYQVQYEPIPLHPHNAPLQVWLEMGAVGALIGLGLLLSILRAIYRRVESRPHRAAACALFTTALSLSSISFGIWQSWWLSSILLSAAFLISTLQPAKTSISEPPVEETGGPKGLEPTRYGDWERKGRAVDF
jgi:exopolysaccharide production protein ExoQ